MKINFDNFLDHVLVFRDRQAGIGVVYDPEVDRFFYNAYCLETKVLKELFSCEFAELNEALSLLHDEFGSWQLKPLNSKNEGCTSCAAK